MADVVQFKIERMLDELDDLERRGMFSHREITKIVKRRRKFEYRLKRPSPLKQDFLAYIDYEKNLESLRILPLAQLVRLHPKVPGVWIYAAAWEFDHNLNVAAARSLMQNCLRACPISEDSWIQYIRMELTYLNKLKPRKVALGEDEGTLTRDKRGVDEKQWRDENKELFMALNEPGEYDKMSAHQDGESMGKVDLFKEHGLNILQSVYNAAILALPTSLSLRTRLLEILEAIDQPLSDDTQNRILDDMKMEFSKDPCYWDWLAKVKIDGTKGINSE